MRKIKQLVCTLTLDASGQNLVDYALIAGLLGLGSVVALTSLGRSIAILFNAVSNRLANMT